ncbi:hypothetical protein Tco_0283901, partial [Tanacetum coccineum]
MAMVKVCISTRAKGFINSAIRIMIDDKWGNVRVYEDPTKKSNFADYEKSVDDEVSSEDAGDDAFSGNFLGDKEDQYYPLDNTLDKDLYPDACSFPDILSNRTSQDRSRR